MNLTAGFTAFAAAAGCGLLIRSAYERSHFVTEEVELSSGKIKREHRLLFLTDVHDQVFGADNEELIAAMKAAKPDAILIGGDLMVAKPKHQGDLTRTFALMEACAGLAPTFYALGNHEMRLNLERESYGHRYDQLLKKADELGIHMLIDGSGEIFEDLVVNGVDMAPEFYKKLFFAKPPHMREQYLEEKLGKPDRNRYQILLMHSPLYFKECRDWGADLTLSGHFHGGTIQLPGLGGVMTPQYQFFLPWCAGKFTEQGKTMLVGRGLGTHSINIRLNDRPQLLLVHLTDQGSIEADFEYPPDSREKDCFQKDLQKSVRLLY